MKKIYHLKTCSTCVRIIKELEIDDSVELQNIKEEKIKEEQLDEMAKLAGSYESLFSRKAMKFRSMGLGSKDLKEKDYKKLILEEYTFLKRPVTIIENDIFVGNSKNVVAAAKNRLHSNN